MTSAAPLPKPSSPKSSAEPPGPSRGFRLSSARDLWQLPAPFADPSMEAAYLQDYLARFADQRFFMSCLALVLWSCFHLLDLVGSQSAARLDTDYVQVSVVRGAATAMLALSLLVAYYRRDRATEYEVANLIVFAGMFVYTDVCVLLVVASSPYNWMVTFLGLVMVEIYAAALLRLNARRVLGCMLYCVVAGNVTHAIYVYRTQALRSQGDFASLGLIYLQTCVYFVFIAAVIGVVIANLMERSARASFKRELDLADINRSALGRSQEVEALNGALRDALNQQQRQADAMIAMQAQLRDEAESRNREKSHFLAEAVHDLKQPLQAISTVLRPVRHSLDRGDMESAQRQLDLASSAVRLMREQLTSLLEISRLESGYIRADRRHINLWDVLRDLASQLGRHAQHEGVTLDIASETQTPVWIDTDPLLLQRMLTNVLSNGVKFRSLAQPHPWVRVSVRTEGALAIITVADNGQGIAAEHLQSGAIFKPFFQANNHRPESDKGVGLGLSIVRAMLDILKDHEVDIQSLPGIGTQVSFKVPLGLAQSRSVLVARPGPMSEAEVRSTLSGAYLLLVEDDALVRVSMQEFLESHGAICAATQDHAAAVALLAQMERAPDLVITDFRLPDGRTGLDVLAAVEEAWGEVPALILSGETQSFDMLSARSDSTLLRKPVGEDEILRVVCQLVPVNQGLPGLRAASASPEADRPI